MKRREFLRHLHHSQCVLLREGGNHSWWCNLHTNHRSAVPRHQEINDYLVKKICKDLDIPLP
ncbi:MAG: type II toxin-antitoxin system HicA family toxin [Verrucomicrobiales bacterium]|nr:type II toxin-antitoxin system HicA family toxin [Verrucomicrobiales bacterium]